MWGIAAQRMCHLAAAHASKNYACLLTNLLPVVLLSWKYGGSSIVYPFTRSLTAPVTVACSQDHTREIYH